MTNSSSIPNYLTPLPILLEPFDTPPAPVKLSLHQLALFIFWIASIVVLCLIRGRSLLAWLCLPSFQNNSSSHQTVHYEVNESNTMNGKPLKRSRNFNAQSFFNRDFEEISQLVQSIVIFGAIMYYFYYCDISHHWPISNRSYNRDVYFTIILVAFLVGISTIKKVGGLTTNEKIRLAAEASAKGHKATTNHNNTTAAPLTNHLLSPPPTPATSVDNINNNNNNASTTIAIGMATTAPAPAPAPSTSAPKPNHNAVKGPGKPVILNRDQSDEWKGWMQMAFVLYHFYRAAEVYNEIRVFVAAYVFLTGFGNFSYFWTKKDFSFFRVCKMLFRLNFLVILVMAVTNNRYVLYYICPMHTFWFLVVYVSMRLLQSYYLNRLAMFSMFTTLFVLSFLIWDWPLQEQEEPKDHGVVDGSRSGRALIGNIFFKPLGFILSESNGSLHEWLIRSGLDHFPALVGMLFAYFHPNMQKFLTWLEELPMVLPLVSKPSGSNSHNDNHIDDDDDNDDESKRQRAAPVFTGVFKGLHSVLVLCLPSSVVREVLHLFSYRVFCQKFAIKSAMTTAAILTLYFWYQLCGALPKQSYQTIHPYVSMIPILAFLLLRNLWVPIRTRFIGLFAWLGSITLETYIAQFHILMQVNATKVIVYLPGYPLLNFILAVSIYLFLSYWLFKLTVAFSTLLLPEEAGKPEGTAARESMLYKWIGILCSLGVCYLISIFVLHEVK